MLWIENKLYKGNFVWKYFIATIATSLEWQQKPSTFVLTDKKVKCLKKIPEQEMLQTFDDGNPGRSHQYLSDIWEKFYI